MYNSQAGRRQSRGQLSQTTPHPRPGARPSKSGRMPRSWKRLLVSALTLIVHGGLLGCGPPPGHTDAGASGRCKDTSKSPPNLLENPGFECDAVPAEWSAIYGTLELVAPGRSGRAAQVKVDQLGGRFAYAKIFAADAGTKSYCFSAWLQGTAPFMRMRVLRDCGGSVQDVAFSEQIFSNWRRIPTLEVPNENAPTLKLVFEVQTNRSDGLNAKPGEVMLIDDVDVWESSSKCAEQR